ncbi:glycoside hydrolase family 108 protein [Achromobacter sp. 2789STDY5608628]|uniref:glycoside hydrolase family 108 protein n=1 Tax=Achromobacter sp. 2789STDY5608628 TaxID=1806493 RepID=UPI0006C1EAA9|nr:glycosyl hydrolase 108 family protein [Achromobacter sp. 2789STDY5608628]CUJ80982.1 Predicted lysozyme (DUF847) [Achromobacter sp. 2789STDY5608628]
MKQDFYTAFDRLIGHEGGYSNHPDDPGGETMWGITVAVARANGYAGAMCDLPRDAAKNIYRAQYWDKVRADSMPFSVAFQVFDAAVNHGSGQAARFLQRAVGRTSTAQIVCLQSATATTTFRML